MYAEIECCKTET